MAISDDKYSDKLSNVTSRYVVTYQQIRDTALGWNLKETNGN